MVRLKGRGNTLLRNNIANFNSTMVRLKVVDAQKKAQQAVFQFHYGTIKSENPYAPWSGYSISIPLWYD